MSLHYICVWLLFLLGVSLLVASLVMPSPASGHSWYDRDCCTDRDCVPVRDEDVVEQMDGSVLYVPDGAVFTRGQKRPSRDMRKHVCINRTVTPPKPLCVYLPTFS